MRLGKKRSATDDAAPKLSKRAARKQAKKAAESAPRGLVETLTDPKTTKRALAVAKLAGPVVAPVALKMATGMRGFLDERRADRLGVPVEDVAGYRGTTGTVAARIDGLRASIDDLRRRRGSDLQVVRFSDVARDRLADLAAATRAAASMPPGRRRATLGAVDRDLAQIEADLMTFLVGSPG